MLNQERPPIWIGHIILPTPDLESTHEFMVTLGMRPIARGVRSASQLVAQARSAIQFPWKP